MSFYEEFVKAQEYLERKGHSVTIPRYDELPEPVPLSYKRQVMDEFNEKLKKADALIVLNYTKETSKHHIGVNTLMEIGIAFHTGKKIYLLYPPAKHLRHELDAINCTILEGNITII